MSFQLNQHTHRLLKEEPFWATLSRRINKRSSDSIPTAGVRVNPHHYEFELLYNPKFMKSLSDEDKTLLLRHEFFHLILGHCGARKSKDKDNFKTWNIAQDLAINGEMFREYDHSKEDGSLSSIACIPGKNGSMFSEYPVGLTAEAYFEMLKNDAEFQGAFGGEGEPQTIDDHSGFDGTIEEVPNEALEIAKQKLRAAAQKAAEESSKSSDWGTVSSEMRDHIISILKNTVNWKSVLRYFVKTSQRADKRSSVKSINKRYPYIHPGRLVQRQAKIAVAVDESGSVSDEMLCAFFGALDGLAQIAEFTVIPFDYTVAEDRVFTWKKGKHIKPERVLTGGTNFDPPTVYANERNFDALIICTDMGAPKPIRSKIPRLWVTDTHNKENPYFTPDSHERMIAIDYKKTN